MEDESISPSVKELLDIGTQALSVAAESPRLDARLLLATAIDCNASDILMQVERSISAAQSARYRDYIKRRCEGEPVSRILGQREFWSLPFSLSNETLDPRPDSETVIETVLKLVGDDKSNSHSVLDLGTGTGCLLLSLLQEWPSATGLGVDVSKDAIGTAYANSKALGMERRACWMVGDWLNAVAGTFDVIVSNPPYIRAGDMCALQTEVRVYDPKKALDGGLDGLEHYRKIIPDLGRILAPGGVVVLEIGFDQEQDVRLLLSSARLTRIESHRDLGGQVRCVSAATD